MPAAVFWRVYRTLTIVSSPAFFMEGREYNLFSKVLSGTFAEAELKDLSLPIDENECAENYGYCSDSDLEDDDDTAKEGEAPKKTATFRGHPFDPFCFTVSKEMPTYGQHKEFAKKGTVIKVQDIAFITCVFPDKCCPLLTTWQIPGIFTLSIHRFHRICAIWIGEEPQVKEYRNRFPVGGLGTSTITKVDLSSCRQGLPPSLSR